MLVLLLFMLLAVMATVFATDNMHRVAIGLVVGPPVHVRLLFALLTCFLTGCFTTTLVNLYRRTKREKSHRIARTMDSDDFLSE